MSLLKETTEIFVRGFIESEVVSFSCESASENSSSYFEQKIQLLESELLSSSAFAAAATSSISADIIFVQNLELAVDNDTTASGEFGRWAWILPKPGG